MLLLLGKQSPKRHPSPYKNPFLSPAFPLKPRQSTDISWRRQALLMESFRYLYPKLLITLPGLREGNRGRVWKRFKTDKQARDRNFAVSREERKRKSSLGKTFQWLFTGYLVVVQVLLTCYSSPFPLTDTPKHTPRQTSVTAVSKGHRNLKQTSNKCICC